MKKPRRATAVRPNEGVMSIYRRHLNRFIREMNEETLARPFDSATLRHAWKAKFDNVALAIGETVVNSTVMHTDRAFAKALENSGLSVKFELTEQIKNVIDAAIVENVALIRKLPDEYYDKVADIVRDNFKKGSNLKLLIEDLQELYPMTKRRASLIARDQTRKITSTANATRALELGLNRATWLHSSGGKHPRRAHVEASGKEFDLSEGLLIDGKYILPGEEINCRCVFKVIVE